jgi:hypothetical protein
MEGEGGGGEVVTGLCAEADIAAFYQAIAENDTERMAELLTQCPLLRHLLATAGRFLCLSPSPWSCAAFELTRGLQQW